MSIAISRWQFSTTDFRKMGEFGILDEDDRVELIDGEVRNMTPIGEPHVTSVNRLTAMLSSALSGRAFLSVQNPVILNDFTQPQPDLLAMRWRADFNAGRLPRAEDALLVIEVADSSLDYDRHEKIPRYAAAGIPEAWLIDLGAATVTQYTQPTATGYQSAKTFNRGQTLEMSGSTGLAMSVNDILG